LEEDECSSNTRRGRLSLNGDPSLCATLYTVGVFGELYQQRSALLGNRGALQTTTPSGLWTSGNGWLSLRPAVMTESWGPGLGPQLGETINNYPQNGLVKPPRSDTRAFSPAGMFGWKAPLRLAAQKSRPHAPLAPMCIAPSCFRGGGGPTVKICVYVFVVLLRAYSHLEEHNQPQPEGKRPAWPVVRRFSQKKI
jgi:hypothetical protein